MREIIIKHSEEKNIITLVEDYNIVEKYEENIEKQRLEGNIYLGKIQRVLPGLQAVFVDIGNTKNAFLHIKDIMPKVSNLTGNKNENFDEIDINKYVKVGMPVIVQVKKDSIMQKGPRVSTHINLPGRFVVAMPGTEFVTISQKIDDKDEIKRLKSIVEENVSKDLGIIIRTSAIGKSKEEIKKDLEDVTFKLEKIYSNLKEIETNDMFIPKLLYTNNKVIDRLLVDIIDKGIDRIIVDDNFMYKYVLEILKTMQKEENIKLEIKTDIFNIYNIKKQLEKIESRKIWLKCGGFITIDKTEALTAIDVNTGKYIGKQDLNDTILTVNKEATIEIAKQLKVRDIGGIIIVDYIDMNEENRKKILDIFNECIKSDRSKVQIVGFTPLNLLELTRKHMWS